jgi:hypothetical protein
VLVTPPPPTPPNPPELPYYEVGSGSYSRNLHVSRIGAWQYLLHPFTSSVSSGTKVDQTNVYGWVFQINLAKSYSASQLAGMRVSPDTVTVNASQGDPSSPIPGPFNAKHTMKVWFPERLIETHPVQETPSSQYLPLMPGNVMEATTTPNNPGTYTFAVAQAQNAEYQAEVSSQVGISSTTKAFGVKADVGVKLGYKWGGTYTGTTTYSIGPNQSQGYRIRLRVDWTRYNLPRTLANYDSSGYNGDELSTIINSRAPKGVLVWEVTPI